MARILLGVTGGIAAYKALELTRLAIKAGHAVRVIQTEASTRFVGAAVVRRRSPARPCSSPSGSRDPLRGAFPGDPPPDHAPLSHLELVERADVFLIAPASANTIAKLAGGHADNLLTAAALACRRPLIVAPAMNDAMYEHPATQANLAHAARARRRRCSSRAPARSARRGVGRRAGCPSRPSCWPRSRRALRGRPPRPRRPARPRHRRRHARADRRRALRRQPLVRAHGLRARRGGGAPRRRGHRGGRQRRAAARTPAIGYVDVQTAEELAAACEAAFDACRRAADGRRRRRLPARRPRTPARSRRTRPARNSSCVSCVHRTCSPPSPPAAAPASCSSASPPSTATRRVAYGARSSSARGSTPSSSTTSARPASPSTPPTTRS